MTLSKQLRAWKLARRNFERKITAIFHLKSSPSYELTPIQRRRFERPQRFTINEVNHFTFAVIFCVVAFFGVLLVWIELQRSPELRSVIWVLGALIVGLYSLGLGLILLSHNILRVEQNEEDSMAYDYFQASASDLTAADIQNFYKEHQELILKNDRIYQQIISTFERRRSIYTWLCMITGLILTFSFDFVQRFMRDRFLILKLLVVLAVFGFITYLMWRDLQRLKAQKQIQLEILSEDFHRYLNQYKLTDQSIPQTGDQSKIVRFLELSHFFVRYYHNHQRKRNLGYLNILILVTIALFLQLSPNSPGLFKQIGFGLLIIAIIYFAIFTVKYNNELEIYNMAKTTLQSYVPQ